jgi:hypothetical protein
VSFWTASYRCEDASQFIALWVKESMEEVTLVGTHGVALARNSVSGGPMHQSEAMSPSHQSYQRNMPSSYALSHRICLIPMPPPAVQASNHRRRYHARNAAAKGIKAYPFD